jgi:hypothetical protein
MTETLSGLPAHFSGLLSAYHSQITDAIRKHSHHDHRRALLMEFIRKSFGIEIDEIELELKIKVAEARGRIDAFYKFVIFEVKIDMEGERDDAIRELTKYFESRKSPEDYIAAVTDGIRFELYDYDTRSSEPKEIRRFEIDVTDPYGTYLELDEILSAGEKIRPSSDDIVGRFGLETTTFLRSLKQLEDAFNSVEGDSTVTVKFREWNALLSKVYGSAIGDKHLFLKHTYLTILSRAIVTMALFPKQTRSHNLYRELLTGKFFRDHSILNLAEPDFFSWCLGTAAEKSFFDIVDALFKRLGQFNWGRIDEDMLKMLYQELIDPTDRSALGEYYTPDWLAELILEDIDYESGSLLDPACGSGTFLFSAINRLRSKGYSGRQLVLYVTEYIMGLDVHPVAVLMAKANILLALAPELKSKRDYDVKLRVYMSDTLQTEEKKTKNYLSVPDGMGHDFLIPLKSIELNRDLDQIIDQMMSFAQRGATSDVLLDQARKGFFAKIKDLTMEEQNLWKLDFDLMVKLVRERRDSVWAFILKNAYRPAYIRRAKVDVIVGNPPWLSFRDIVDKSYKARIKDLTFKYKLLDRSERKLSTQMDTSTLFYVHSCQEFLKEDGRIAFVMPKTVILPAKQHLGFQRYGLTRIHDFSKVTVTGTVNQHFFNVKSCVVISSGKVRRTAIPMTLWKGTLPKKNLTLRDCRPFLSQDEQRHDFMSRSKATSPYYHRAFQGATLNPHTLWLVDIDDKVPLNVSRPMVKTSEDSYKLCKEKKWKLRVRGPIEREFLFGTALSDDILPFCVRSLRLAVLPVSVDQGRYAMMKHDEMLGEGFEAASDWVRRAENIFAKNSKDKNMSAQNRLNFQKLLTTQTATSQYTVLYNKSGTNISAAYLNHDEWQQFGDIKVKGFVAESVTYRIYTSTQDEALYLVAVLNSTVVNEAIKPFQTEGVYHGKRDIHRRPFEVCPIPEFDANNANHARLATLGGAARKTIRKAAAKMEGGLARVRENARKLVIAELQEIDRLVLTILDDVRLHEVSSEEGNKKDSHSQDALF